MGCKPSEVGGTVGHYPAGDDCSLAIWGLKLVRPKKTSRNGRVPDRKVERVLVAPHSEARPDPHTLRESGLLCKRGSPLGGRYGLSLGACRF